MRQSIFIGIFLLVSSAVISQKVVMKNYRSADGLPSNQAFHVMQDSKGFIWIGTDKGVSRFDGYEFKNFDSNSGLAGNTILDIYEDYKGRVWFISLMGKLSYFENGRINQYPHNEKLVNKYTRSPIPLKRSFLVDTNDNVYISIRPLGIFRINEAGEIKIWESWPKYTNRILNKDERPLISNYRKENKEILILNNQENKVNTIELPNELTGKRGLTITNRTNSSTHYFSNTSSVVKIKDKNAELLYHDKEKYIIEFFIDNHGHPWLGFEEHGAIEFNDTSFDIIRNHYLKDKSISTVFMDKDEGIWFSTLNNGVFYVPDRSIKVIRDNTDTKSNHVADVQKIKDTLIIFYENGSVSIDRSFSSNGQNDLTTTQISKNPLENIYSTFNGKEKIWIAANLEFYSLDKKNLNLTSPIVQIKSTKNVLGSGVKSIYQTKEGKLFLGHASSLLEVVEFKADSIFVERKSRFRTSCISGDVNNDNLWLGGLFGLYEYRIASDSMVYHGNFLNGLKTRIQDIIVLNEQEIICATKGRGLILYNHKYHNIDFIDKNAGLSSNFITSLKYLDTLLYVGTNNGLDVVNLKNKEQPSVIQFSEANGLPSNQINKINHFDSLLFISTEKGLSYFKTPFPKLTKNKLNVRIIETSAAKSDEGVKMVSYPHKTISFKYTPLVFYHAKDLLYKYRIAGLTEEWQYTTNNSVFFPYVPEGSYNFEIAVKDKSGQWGHLTSMPFIIETPFWKTHWFIASGISVLIVIISAVIILIISNRRLKARAKQEVIKYQQQALSNQMNPHFLFNSLNSIHRYLLENNSIFASKYLSKFARLMRLFLNNSEKETITIEKEVESISLYLELENLRMKNAFDFNVHIDKNLKASETLMPTMLLQPIVENAVIHGIRYLQNANGLIEMSFIREGDFLKIVITDNGVGRDRASEIEHKNNQKSHGGSIVRKRIKLLNQLYQASISINYLDLHRADSQNKGTKVIIKNIPINLSKNDQDLNN